MRRRRYDLSFDEFLENADRVCELDADPVAQANLVARAERTSPAAATPLAALLVERTTDRRDAREDDKRPGRGAAAARLFGMIRVRRRDLAATPPRE